MPHQTIVVRTQAEQDEIDYRRSQGNKRAFPVLLKGFGLWVLMALIVGFILFKSFGDEKGFAYTMMFLIVSFWIVIPITIWRAVRKA